MSSRPNTPTATHQPSDSEMVKSLLSRQDEVIAELDLLDAQILEVIEDLNAQRKSEAAESTDDVEVESLPMAQPISPPTTSRAA